MLKCLLALKGTGQTRIVYRVDGEHIEVLIIAVGMRRDNEIYEAAGKRSD
jgi:mRNA interferase RelE/StbE